MKKKGKSRVVYILAASHSGSTLTTMLLNSHPDISTIGEIKATSLGDIGQYRCSCRKRIRECEFWQDIKKSMADRGHDFDIENAGTDVRSGSSKLALRLLRPLHRGRLVELLRDFLLWFTPGWASHLENVQKTNSHLIESVLERTKSNVIVDSSKIGIRLKYLLRNSELDVRVVRVVRDGRAVALTYMDPEEFADASDKKLRGGGMGANRDSEKLTMESGAHEWRRSNEEAEAIVMSLEESRWDMVRYEDLCANPDVTLNRLFEFIGVDPEKRNKNFRATAHHIIGNGMRLNTTSEIRLDDRWRKVLSKKELEEFEAISGELNRKYGYQ